ncbi:MAG: 4'-phosphopantetheinyl transferase superfamily protein [Cycloclasticus sp.]|nr:4'-phosphopantetheinyl transferase superfamily protein [Cycloclasticus sp.]
MVGFTPKNKTVLQRLETDVVHVWQLDLQYQVNDEAASILSAEERAKVERLRAKEHRQFGLSMRMQLRLLLSRYIGVQPSDIAFSEGEFGKPYLINPPLFFNVSHTGSKALVAISFIEEIGVDIEQFKVLDNREGIVKRHFTGEEKQAWLTISETERKQVFFDIWTRKEAFIKATGRGLGLGLSRCGFSLTKPYDLLECPSDYGHHLEWACMTIDIDSETSASLILKGAHFEPVIFQFDPENLP